MSERNKLWIQCMELGARCGCHQKPDRSFTIGEYQFPVCARCTGIILSSIIAPIIYTFVKLSVKFYVIMVVVMGIDGGLQYYKIKESTNCRRFVTGCMGGLGLTSIKILIFCFIYKRVKEFMDKGSALRLLQ